MDVQTKAGKYVVEIKSTSATTKAPNGSFEAVLSVPVKDRDGEVVDAGAFNPLPPHMPIDLDHAMTVEKTVASGRPFYDGDVLKFEGTYASHPLAQMVRSLVDEGHIRTMSVAYMNGRYEIDEKDGLPHLRSAELLNAGIVGIPANREALITASKSFTEEVVEAVVAPETPPTLADVMSELKAIRAELATKSTGVVTYNVPAGSYTISDKKFSTETTPETPAAADEAAADKSPVEVEVAQAQALAAMGHLALIPQR
jgi:HK97 family phage prohead protease